MKSKSIYILLLAFSIFAISCTNNGDIGTLYGIWALDDLSIDGKRSDIEYSEYYFKFQSNIIEINKQKGIHDYYDSTGTWERHGVILLLNFTHHRPDWGETSLSFNPPPELGIPGREISRLEILSESSKRLVLRYVNADGQTLVYTLRKLK